MSNLSYIFNAESTYIDAVYKQYSQDPSSVDQNWRLFFEGFEFNAADDALTEGGLNPKELKVFELINGYRKRGHLLSTTNPIRQRKDRNPKLDAADYGLDASDLKQSFIAGNAVGLKSSNLQAIIDRLKSIYTKNIGFEYHHIDDQEKRQWLQDKIESGMLAPSYGISIEQKKRILEKLNGAAVFEKFLHTKYIGQKRFSLEGGESTIAALDAIIEDSSAEGVKEIVIGMAHRGRLNVLANVMGKTYDQIFNEFEGTSLPDQSFGDGDVKYHLGFESQVEAKGGTVELKLAPNPSHLEAVNTVVQGYSRAKADMLYASDYDKILPILIHGDAAVAGQGIVYETVQMSQLPGYYTGGTLHFVINNQIGFTTDFDDARSSTYSTSIASLVQAPVFHVNGDDPEAVVFASQLAVEFRQKFNSDVFIDMVCYRRHGHNEGDDPKFTQPHLYELIGNHKDPRELYVEQLIQRGDIEKTLAEGLEKEFWSLLQDRLNYVKEHEVEYKLQAPEKVWVKMKLTTDVNDAKKSPKTGITKAKLTQIFDHLQILPEGLTPLSKVKRLQKGKQKLLDNNKIDWALAELAAYSSILMEGKDVRISGQDVKRGTFSHRHAVFNDAETFEEFNRLENLSDDQGKFRIFNSFLSEFGVLGFEYGYALARPNSLTLWEAQFGDFYNGAQTIVDQFVSAGESKWQRMCGLVMLLPHGYEGQGPEHSSARFERFLQLTADFNMTVANISTPANLFHAFRRQLARDYRKPLVIMSPKSLLRHPLCVSSIEDFMTKESFKEVIADDVVKPAKAKKHILCTGKVYYDLLAYRNEHKIDNVAITRIEQLYPFPENQVNAQLDAYKCPTIWVQEESQNMGAWQYLLRYWRKTDIDVVARPYSASPATGYKKVHEKQQAELVKQAFKL